MFSLCHSMYFTFLWKQIIILTPCFNYKLYLLHTVHSPPAAAVGTLVLFVPKAFPQALEETNLVCAIAPAEAPGRITQSYPLVVFLPVEP